MSIVRHLRREVRHRNGSTGTGRLRREDTEPADPSVRLPPSSIPTRAQRTRSRPLGSVRSPRSTSADRGVRTGSSGPPLPEVSRPSRCPARPALSMHAGGCSPHGVPANGTGVRWPAWGGGTRAQDTSAGSRCRPGGTHFPLPAHKAEGSMCSGDGGALQKQGLACHCPGQLTHFQGSSFHL